MAHIICLILFLCSNKFKQSDKDSGMFYCQSLTGELQKLVCLSEQAFFQFSNLTS